MTERFSGPFVAMFEALRMAPTFARGRRDARAGHVRNLSISSSLVIAQVRGPDDARPFRARIAVRAFGAAEWARVEAALATQARYTADLLAGRMPPGIETVFQAEGLTLLPLSLDEVALDCTCERWPMPCVHLAATCYALAESFETDPFGVFAWRGRSREELLTQLTELRVPAAETPSAPPPADATLGDFADFWGAPGGDPAPPLGAARPDLLLDQLDAPPLRYAGRTLPEILRPAYLVLPPEPAQHEDPAP
ncbi:SWIM zinc finger family protein [Symbioplanes lichenis]|uniref:SWIM zinc finger family protein n=1 Tax=Symbioplanes lichenis TaxID=1629072 RepID=UPI002738B565|nr:hypothetical protein [Actinoplanes lichenis]